MTVEYQLNMESPLYQKAAFGMLRAITAPRATLSWVIRGHLARDATYVGQTYWVAGTLPRTPLAKILQGVESADVVLPRAFDRNSSLSGAASISVNEACHLGAITRHLEAKSALEIGTFDGNTALLLAANMPTDGQVVTVDLPPDFDMTKKDSLRYPGGEINLTPRNLLGRQYKGHRLSSRIRQVYGDSATLDWSSLGGPFDLVFIDGCHTEAYVQSDSENAMNQLAPGGVIVWHDYGMIRAVSKVVDRIALGIQSMKVFAIEGTRLSVGLKWPFRGAKTAAWPPAAHENAEMLRDVTAAQGAEDGVERPAD